MNTIRMVTEAYHRYFGASGLGLLVCIALIWMIQKKRGEKFRLFALTGIILAVVALCPLSAWVIARVIGADVYWRIFWAVPCIAAAALFLTEWICAMTTRVKKILAGAVCVLLIAVNGTLVFSGEYFEKRENNYKLPTEIIRIADAIEEDQAIHRVKRKIVAPVEIAFLIRLYDPALRQSYGRGFVKYGGMHDLYEQVNSLTPNLRLLAEEARADDRRYIVIYKEADNRAYMEDMNFEAVFDDCGYVVYFDRNYERKAEKDD